MEKYRTKSIKINKEEVVLFYPLTGMNRSGEALRDYFEKEYWKKIKKCSKK